METNLCSFVLSQSQLKPDPVLSSFLTSLVSAQVCDTLWQEEWKSLVVQSLSRVWLCNFTDCSTPGFPVLHHLPEFAQTHVQLVMPATHRVLCSSVPPLAFNLSPHQVLFQWGGSWHQVPKYWSFRFSISPSNEYSGLTSLRINWCDLLTVQGTLKSLLWHHNLIPEPHLTQMSLTKGASALVMWKDLFYNLFSQQGYWIQSQQTIENTKRIWWSLLSQPCDKILK